MQSPTKRRIKEIRSLQQKKFRKELGLFTIEGAKNVLELCEAELDVREIFCSQSFFTSYEGKLLKKCKNVAVVSPNVLVDMGTFSSNNAALAVVSIPENRSLKVENDYVLVLDEVRDPGNLGTIIRAADWYGISKIICSENCVDVFNPKVINSTMGSFARVKVYYTDLIDFFVGNKEAVYGAFLDGESVHTTKFKPGYVLMGSESHGVGDALKTVITKKITIPKYGAAESLNVAIATAIICDNIFRS